MIYDDASLLEQIFYAYTEDSFNLLLLFFTTIVVGVLLLVPLERARERMDGDADKQIPGVMDHPVYFFGVGLPVTCALIVGSLFVSIGFSGDAAQGKRTFGQLSDHYGLPVEQEYQEDISFVGLFSHNGVDAYRSVGDVISHPGEYRKVVGFDLASAGFDDTYTLYGLTKGDTIQLFVSKTESKGKEFIELDAR